MLNIHLEQRGRRDHDRRVVGFTTNYAISAYHHWCCEFESRSGRVVLDTTLCDKVCQWLATVRWFSPGTPVSSTNKTDRHDITEILLKVALNTIKPALLGYNMFSGRLSKVENKKWMMLLIVCFFTCDCNTRYFIYLDLKHVSHPTEKLKPIIFILFLKHFAFSFIIIGYLFFGFFVCFCRNLEVKLWVIKLLH